MKRWRFALIALFLMAVQWAPALAGRPMTVDDLFRLRRVGSPQLSPDGRWIVYTVSEVSLDKDRTFRHLYRVSFTGEDTVQLTRGEHSDWNPQWRPDGGMIAFSSDRSGRAQIWIMNPFYGEPGQLTEVKTGVGEWVWSHDGTRIAFTSRDSLTRAEERKRKSGDDARVEDEKFRMMHLYVIDLRSRKIRRLTRGAFTVSSPRWSPDDRFIYFVQRPTPKADDRWKADIMMVPSDSGAVRTLVATAGSETAPLPSPDGQWVAYAFAPGPGSWIGNQRLYLIPAFGGSPQRVETDFDGSIVPLKWTPDSRGIYFGTTTRVSANLFLIDVVDGGVNNISRSRNVLRSFSFSKDAKRVAFIMQRPDRPAEVYSSEIAAFAPRRLTYSNPFLKQVVLGKTEVVRWRSFDGREIEGLLIKPLNFVAGRRFPLIVGIHGGPSGVYTRSFLASWASYPHILAGRGYAVFLPNYRGSSGYGEKFQRADIRDWGHGDFLDIMTGVDSLIAWGIADSTRMGVMGWSYGGYMTYWTVTQTHRFRAASAGAGLTNIFSMYSENDIPSVLEAYFGAQPWDDVTEYHRASPMTYVKNVETPLLILQGEQDPRVPRFQAMEFYTALQKMGKKTKMVLFPRQGHGLGEPRLQHRKVEEELNWFERYIRGVPEAPKSERLSVTDVLELPSVGNPQISPDGKTVLFTVSRWKADRSRRVSHIFRVDVASGEVVQLTRSEGGEKDPRWAPDGSRFAFLSARRGGKAQLFVMSPFWGEAGRLTEVKSGVDDFRWGPRGRWIAFTSKDTLTEQQERRRESGDDAKVWMETEQKRHLWLVNVDTRQIRRLTRGPFNVLEFAWSPDGKEIAFTSARFRVAEAESASELRVVDVAAGSVRHLLPGEVGFRGIRWSPDGRKLAVINTRGAKRGDILRKPNIFLLNRDGSGVRNLTADFPWDVSGFCWSPDGRQLLILGAYRLSSHFYRYSLAGGRAQRISEGAFTRRSFSLSGDGRRVAFLRTDPQHPAEVFVASLAQPYREDRLTDFTAALWAKALGRTEVLRWKSADGTEIEGLLVKPPDYEEGLHYPLIVMPHGGPAGHYSLSFHSLAQLYAARGYLVLLPNVRGSSGYGQAFLRANIGDLGGGDFQDLMSGVDELVRRGVADPDRLGIWGWSYGGYMAAWAVSQTDRFKAAVVGAAVTDWFSVYGHDDIQYDVEEYFRGTPYDRPELVAERSPMTYVKRVKTPTLILHGEKDFRDPLPQAQNFYLALKKRGVEVQFVVYPREGHGIREFSHRKDMLRRSLEWMDDHLEYDPTVQLP